MREDFLYHLWKFQKFDTEGLKTSEGDALQVIHPGIQTRLSGPDFFNARISIGGQLWAGNVEMHLRSSHWYAHHHEIDSSYDNVILHVVWEHDVEIYRKDRSVIPSLVLKPRVDEFLYKAYSQLLEKEHLKINCEQDFPGFSEFQLQHWLERLFFERLERKSSMIAHLLKKTENNWEAVLFIMLARSFGSKVNADAFMDLAANIDFRLVQKYASSQLSLEALLFGQANLIRETDKYGRQLQKEYDFLKHKHSLQSELSSPQFFRLRPDNFPTLRLAQLAALYARKGNIFRDLMQTKDLMEIKAVLKLDISPYWKAHYNFSKAHPSRNKSLTDAFMNTLIINCIVPLKHCYFQFLGEDDGGTVHELINSVRAEKNSIVDLFQALRPGTASTAMHSQALVQLKTAYCDVNKCLHCELGASLLRKSPKYI